jgi:hypothetical protein
MSRSSPVRIDLWFDCGCPNEPLIRERLHRALASFGAAWTLHEHPDEGQLSPTLMMNGRDVCHIARPQQGCRLELPTVEEIERALRETEMGAPVAVAPGIGRIGRVLRVLLGTLLLAAAVAWASAGWWDVALGVVVLPLVSLAASVGLNRAICGAGSMPSVRRAWSAAQLVVAGCILVAVTVVGVGLTFVSPADGPAGLLIFLGVSMLVAAIAKYDGCEVLALPNLLLGRRDAIWRPIYSPIDTVEQRRRQPAPAPGAESPVDTDKAYPDNQEQC